MKQDVGVEDKGVEPVGTTWCPVSQIVYLHPRISISIPVCHACYCPRYHIRLI